MVTNFHELYQSYAQDVYRFAYWIWGNAQDAEDITSETFLRALTSTGEIKKATVKGYLLTIARNLAYKKSNREKRLGRSRQTSLNQH
jgi:RNA polymerase sigma-70 factor (ECF subfamily)